MTHIRTVFLTLILLISGQIQAQSDTVSLSLEELIILAQTDAPDVQIAKTALNNNSWR